MCFLDSQTTHIGYDTARLLDRQRSRRQRLMKLTHRDARGDAMKDHVTFAHAVNMLRHRRQSQ